MAHIPQDARYVDPPSEREVDEDRITEEARDIIARFTRCPSCKARVADSEPDEVYERWADAHAETCDRLRARAIDALYGEDA